jgi:hypothetical protein
MGMVGTRVPGALAAPIQRYLNIAERGIMGDNSLFWFFVGIQTPASIFSVLIKEIIFASVSIFYA